MITLSPTFSTLPSIPLKFSKVQRLKIILQQKFQELVAKIEKIRVYQTSLWAFKYEPSQAISKTFRVLSYLHKSINSIFALRKEHHKVQDATQHLWTRFHLMHVFIKYAKLGGLISAPWMIFTIIKNSWILSKGNPADKVDASLRLLESCSSLLDGGVSFSRGLAEILSVSSSTWAWIPILNIFSTFLSVATVAFHGRRWQQTETFMDDISLKSLHDPLLQEKENEICMSKIGQVDVHLMQKILKVDAKKFQQTALKVQGLKDQKAISNFISKSYQYGHAIKISHVLKGTAALVNVIALVILLTGVLAPLAFAFIAIAAGLHLAGFIQEKYHFRKIEAYMDGMLT